MTFLPTHPSAFATRRPTLATLRTATAATAVPPFATGSSFPTSSLPPFASSSTVGDHATATAATIAPSMTTMSTSSTSSADGAFEAVVPNPAPLAAMGSVVLLCVAAGYVWANDVVPVSRTKLAISKSRGEVRVYLDGLRPAEDAIVDDDTSYSTTLAVSDDPSAHVKQSDVSDIKPNVGDGRDFERWLFADWLNKPYKKGGRQKEPALPILKQAKWNSGDNPVLVTAAIMMLGVVLASITERIAT